SSYLRPGERPNTEHTSLVNSLVRPPTLPSSQRALDPQYIAIDEFEEKLRITRDRKTLKVLGVNAAYAQVAALALTRTFGVRRVSLDQAFSEAIHAVMKEKGVNADVLYAADAAGPVGDDWPELRSVVELAAERVADQLFPAAEP